MTEKLIAERDVLARQVKDLTARLALASGLVAREHMQALATFQSRLSPPADLDHRVRTWPLMLDLYDGESQQVCCSAPQCGCAAENSVLLEVDGEDFTVAELADLVANHIQTSDERREDGSWDER